MAGVPPRLTAQHALFLDFDGTLVPIVPTPDGVEVTACVRDAISHVSATLGGAVAIVTGRTIADVSGHLQMDALAISGSHGIERRLPGGELEQPGPEIRAVAGTIQAELKSRLADYPKLLIETKTWSAALHYRARPELEELCIRTMQDVAAAHPDWEMLRGDMLVEARLSGVSKASAVAGLMEQPPFKGRVPVFIGDDVTDEEGIGAAQDAGGYGIKVGKGESVARYRVEGPDAVLDYLLDAGLTSDG